jgi:hypothetical protein
VRFKPGLSDVLWIGTGAGLMVLTAFLAWHFRPQGSAAELLAVKARKLDLVEGMSLDLASASNAERGAVMAATEQDSRLYADAAIAEAEVKRDELTLLLEAAGPSRERKLLEEFAKLLDSFKSIDRELLALAVGHTNVKAAALAFGPAAQAVGEMCAALDRVAAKDALAPSAHRAEIAALHLQTLLAPHIAEPTEERMGELEEEMRGDDQEVQRNLERLAAGGAAADPDVQAAVQAYGRFDEARADILRLSRENTNVRSLAISLDQKRKTMLLCEEALGALKQAIQEEEIPGVNYGPVSPRRLGDS